MVEQKIFHFTAVKLLGILEYPRILKQTIWLLPLRLSWVFCSSVNKGGRDEGEILQGYLPGLRLVTLTSTRATGWSG